MDKLSTVAEAAARAAKAARNVKAKPDVGWTRGILRDIMGKRYADPKTFPQYKTGLGLTRAYFGELAAKGLDEVAAKSFPNAAEHALKKTPDLIERLIDRATTKAPVVVQGGLSAGEKVGLGAGAVGLGGLGYLAGRNRPHYYQEAWNKESSEKTAEKIAENKMLGEVASLAYIEEMHKLAWNPFHALGRAVSKKVIVPMGSGLARGAAESVAEAAAPAASSGGNILSRWLKGRQAERVSGRELDRAERLATAFMQRPQAAAQPAADGLGKVLPLIGAGAGVGALGSMALQNKNNNNRQY